jgi:serine protease AprX
MRSYERDMTRPYSVVRQLIGTILLVLMAAIVSLAQGQIQTDPVRPPQRHKIDPHLQVLLAEKTPGKKVKVWVLFTDKGIFDDQTYRKALDEQRKRLTPRARARRLNVRDGENLVDFTDLPLHGPYIQEILNTGAQLRTTSRWLNAVSVQADPEQLRRLAALPFVSSLRPVASGCRREPQVREMGPTGPPIKGQFLLDYGPSFAQLDLISVPQFHQWLEQNGHGQPGAGVLICLLDSGYDLDHESLQHVEVFAQWDFINGDGQVADEPGDPPGQDSHGTVVLSVMGGYFPGQLIGPAFGASFLLGKTEDISAEQPIEEDYWVEGIEWAEELGAQVVSSSVGYNEWYTYADMDGNTSVTTVAADLAAAKGIVVVTGAGNEGNSFWRYIIAPADGDQVIAVGAVDTNGVRASFSSMGPTSDGRIKPDVMACGANVYVANPDNPEGYYRSIGTSLSTPLVAGVSALLLQADSTMTPSEVGDALRNTAHRALTPDNLYGWGVLDAQAARQANYRIFGQVLDAATGRPVVGAIVGFETSSVSTSLSGRFATPHLAPGVYDLSVSAPNYLPEEISGIEIPSWVQTVSIELQPISSVTVHNFPNPFSESTTIVFEAPQRSFVKVGIFTLAGELICEHELFWDLGGRCEVNWDGCNQSGEEVADGVYLYQVVIEGDVMRGKMVRLWTQ